MVGHFHLVQTSRTNFIILYFHGFDHFGAEGAETFCLTIFIIRYFHEPVSSFCESIITRFRSPGRLPSSSHPCSSLNAVGFQHSVPICVRFETGTYGNLKFWLFKC